MGEKFPQEFGEYRLLKKIAQGGMAEIFLAQDKAGEIFALKRILPHLAHQEGFIRMFIDEARIVSHLHHANVAGVLDQGKHEGFYWIGMEYVEGHSIMGLMDRAKSQRIPLPRGLLAWIIAELLAGLGYAHAARDRKGRHLDIVHRDVTPQNVLISYDGVVKLIDFGVAKARARLTQTEAGFTKGKLSYMSPEQARGEPLDGRSDLFSVGIILYEITTGSRLFNKEGPGGILSAIVNDPIQPPTYKDRKYPRDLEAILMRALDKDADRRWQSAEDMRDALLRFARRERPKPGRTRLANLVHDLFGDPKHQTLIDEARAVHEPTPPEGSEVAMLSGHSVRVKGHEVPADERPTGTHRGPDETRMMEAAAAAEEISEISVQVKREITSDGTPIVDLPLEHDDIAVPEPRVPLRVKIAQAIASFGSDVRESWAANKKRYTIALSGMFVLLFLTTAYATGLFSVMGRMMSGAVEDARKIKKSAGLSDSPIDAGLKPTILSIRTEPPGASITVDGVGAGCATPCDLVDLEFSKKLSIEITLTGFRARTEGIVLYENQGVRELLISLERETGSLTIVSDPPGAIVYRAGRKLKGATPLTLDGVRTDKPVRIQVRKAGYLSKSRVVVLRDNEKLKELFKLEIDPRSIKPGRVDVDTKPAGCIVTIDGDNIGSSPVSHEIDAGTYSVSALCENYAPAYRTVTVKAGATRRLSLSLEANVFGYLSLSVTPARGSKVSVNGNNVKLPVQFLKVIPGRHEVVVTNDGLRKRKVMSVRVGPKQRVNRVVNLLN